MKCDCCYVEVGAPGSYRNNELYDDNGPNQAELAFQWSWHVFQVKKHIWEIDILQSQDTVRGGGLNNVNNMSQYVSYLAMHSCILMTRLLTILGILF